MAEATVTVHGAVYTEALAACLQRQQHTGALLMHAYDQPEVVAGAGTLAAEATDGVHVRRGVVVRGLVAADGARPDGVPPIEAG